MSLSQGVNVQSHMTVTSKPSSNGDVIHHPELTRDVNRRRKGPAPSVPNQSGTRYQTPPIVNRVVSDVGLKPRSVPRVNRQNSATTGMNNNNKGEISPNTTLNSSILNNTFQNYQRQSSTDSNNNKGYTNPGVTVGTLNKTVLSKTKSVPELREKTELTFVRRRSIVLDDDDSVGFSSLPEQVHRKALKRGFDFTLMVVGESGLGKSTLIQSLFLNTDLYSDRNILPVEDRLKKTVQIEKRYMEIEERGVKLRLTIVDTPGYNDSLTAEDGWKPVETYIDHQFDQYFKDESGLNRKNIKDNRVHCCLYFISPFGHGLRQIDIHFMKRLHHKVNIVPVIAKADTLTKKEIHNMKMHIMDQICNNDIHIYEFPDCDSDEDDDFKQQDKELKASIPFSVIGSNTIVEVNGKKIRGRLYPWGIVDVDNSDHCDFTKLRQMLISTHMQDLKDVTRDIHYENFRAMHITEEMSKQAARERTPHLFEEHITVVRSNSKLKRDSSHNFENIVQTDALLQQKDEEIKKMQQMLVMMQKKLQSPQSSPQRVNGTLK